MHRFKPDKIQELRRRSGHKVTPLTNKIFVINTWCESSKTFSPRTALCIVNHTPGWAPRPKEVNQYKTDSIFVCCFVALVGFCIIEFFVYMFWFSLFYLGGRGKVKELKVRWEELGVEKEVWLKYIVWKKWEWLFKKKMNLCLEPNVGSLFAFLALLAIIFTWKDWARFLWNLFLHHYLDT